MYVMSHNWRSRPQIRFSSRSNSITPGSDVVITSIIVIILPLYFPWCLMLSSAVITDKRTPRSFDDFEVFGIQDRKSIVIIRVRMGAREFFRRWFDGPDIGDIEANRVSMHVIVEIQNDSTAHHTSDSNSHRIENGSIAVVIDGEEDEVCDVEYCCHREVDDRRAPEDAGEAGG